MADVRLRQRISKKVDRYFLSNSKGEKFSHCFNRHSKSGYRNAMRELSSYNRKNGIFEGEDWFLIWDEKLQENIGWMVWDEDLKYYEEKNFENFNPSIPDPAKTNAMITRMAQKLFNQ